MPRNRPQLPTSTKPNISTVFQQALALHQQGRVMEAKLHYELVLQRMPTHFDALHLLGVVALHSRDFERGIELIRKAIKLNPKFPDAHYNLGNGLMELQRPEDALASHNRAIALRPTYSEAHNSRGFALRQLDRFEEALASYDRAIACKPGYREAHNNRAGVLRSLKRYEEALTACDTAISLGPKNAEAHYSRGVVLQDLKRSIEALACYDIAIALKPDYAEAHNKRGHVLSELKRLEEAVVSYDKAISLKPNNADQHYNRAGALKDLGQNEGALSDYRAAISLEPDKPQFHWDQGLCLLQMGRYEAGWQLYEWGKKINFRSNRVFPKPLWTGNEDISNKVLFIHWEQGLGDTIQFCRYGKILNAMGVNVVMSVQQPLYGLLQQLAPDIRIINQDEVPSTFDYHCPLLSLPLAVGTVLENIPSQRIYIVSDPAAAKKWSVRLPAKDRPRIGVVWGGNPNYKNDHNRSVELQHIIPLFSFDAHWISLQKDIKESDQRNIANLSQVYDYSDQIEDFSDTAAIIEHLDLVITVDTSVAHLAGAMGKPAWILLPYNSDWRWLLNRTDSPWYPSVRLFRHDDTRSWSSVIARVRAALGTLSC